VHILKSHPHLHVRIMNSGYGRLLFTLIFTPRSSYVLKVSELYSKLGFTTNFYNLNNNCKRARTRHICNLFRHLNLKWKVSYVLYGYPSLCNSFTWDCLNCTFAHNRKRSRSLFWWRGVSSWDQTVPTSGSCGGPWCLLANIGPPIGADFLTKTGPKPPWLIRAHSGHILAVQSLWLAIMHPNLILYCIS
jgi:hypothetical protein